MDQLTPLLIGSGILFGGFGLLLLVALAITKLSAKEKNCE